MRVAVMHMSNTLPDIRSAAPASSPWETYLLTVGRVVTLNTIQTREGWSYVGAALLARVQAREAKRHAKHAAAKGGGGAVLQPGGAMEPRRSPA